ncbi:MAG: heme biosynthesis HemY N-terminal domain-containing protein [Hyphomicrobiaceae bacterium]|nr:heme biosynthesis HemY N-terminal domain-containing protein [Hyphomicrobiaceae bacterium]
MLRLVAYLLAVLAVASGLAWLADRPGQLIINWQGREIETSVFHAVVILAALTATAIFVWSLLRQMWNSPATVGHFINKRRQRRGLDALSSGMIAIGAGDRATATKYAIQARKSLPNEPLTHLLRAQAAQLSGDRTTARRIFEAMLASPDTEQLGLRGLFVEAQREGAAEPAQQYSQRALRLNPKLAWPVDALFDLQCREGNWAGALDTLATARRNGHVEKTLADRRRAVLLTAQAQTLEDSDAEKALTLASEAHGLAPDLIPAAAIAGRILAGKGNTARAAKILQKTWSKAPHPDLSTAYAFARIGDSPRDRLDRVKQLAALRPYAVEASIAVATAAIEARDWDQARHALAPLLDQSRLTQRAATLMARVEGEQHGDKGRVREWLARAATAQRDAAWTADGIVAERWAAVSPATGQLDAFVWKVPVERVGETDEATLLHDRLRELVAAGDTHETDDVVDADPALPAEVAPPKPVANVAADVVDAEPVNSGTPDAAAEPAPEGRPVGATGGRSSYAGLPAGGPTAARRAKPDSSIAEPAAKLDGPPSQAARIDGSEAAAMAAAPSEPVVPAQRPAPNEPRIFVAPRAPDDPGAVDDFDEQPRLIHPNRAV